MQAAVARQGGNSLPNSATIQRWLFGGWTIAVFAFLYIPILLLVIYSFNASNLSIGWGGFTTKWYEQLFQNAGWLGLSVAALAYWLLRTWLLAIRGQMHDDPVAFALKDRTSWILGLLVGLSLFLAW